MFYLFNYYNSFFKLSKNQITNIIGSDYIPILNYLFDFNVTAYNNSCGLT